MRISSLLAGACAALACVGAAAAPAYDVGAVTGKYGTAVALNERGQVAINQRDPVYPWRGSISGPDGVADFGSFGGPDNTVIAINNRNEAVGLALTADNAQHVFYYTDGQLRDLTVAAGLRSVSVLNDRGQIAGAQDGRAYLYDQGVLGFFGPQGTSVSDISEAGAIVGAAAFDGEHPHAYLYSDGSMTDLGTLGGDFSAATAINERGTIVGYGSTPDGRMAAFVVEAGVMSDIGGGAPSSIALDVNSLGQIVGMAGTLPFLYSAGTLTYLDRLVAPDTGLRLASVSAINDRGEILGVGCNADPTGPSACLGVILSPVPAIPEPLAASMLLAGLTLLGGRQIRRRVRSGRLPIRSAS